MTGRSSSNTLSPTPWRPSSWQATLGLAGAILSIAGLSFLGLGIQPPTPEWGAMLSNARNYFRDAWHVTVIPGLGIMLTILSCTSWATVCATPWTPA